MRVVIAGSRSITNYDLVKRAIEEIVESENLEITEVFSGAAKGVDQLGEQWAQDNNIPVTRYPAPWKDIEGKPKEQIGQNTYGKYWKWAGSARNQMMAQDCDRAIVIHDHSSGSKNMIYEMKELGKPCYERTLDDLTTDKEIGYTF